MTIEVNYTTNVRDAVQEYMRHGFGVVPVDAMQKGPKGSGWHNNSYDPDHVGPGSNIGVKGGKASRDIVPLDLDSPETLAAATMLLPATLSSGHGGKLGHRWFRASGLPEAFY